MNEVFEMKDHHVWKQDARRVLSQAPEAGRLILLFSGVTAAASLLVALLNFLLESGIAGTGGLSGMGMRSILSSFQTTLTLALNVAVPFWSMGYVSAVLKLSRRQNGEPRDLLEGFRRFGPVFRTLLLEYAVYFVTAFLCVQLGTTVLSFTPLAEPFAELVMTMDPELLMAPDEATLYALMEAMVPLLIGCGVLFVAAAAVVSYYLRMTRFLLMDGEKIGAVRALVGSFRMMRGNCLRILRMDLSFWWYYALELVTTAICLGDLWLPALGVTFPFSEDAAYFLFYILGLGAQLAVHWKLRNHLEVSYAMAYEELKTQNAV